MPAPPLPQFRPAPLPDTSSLGEAIRHVNQRFREVSAALPTTSGLPVFNIMDYGAKGDGRTDDTAAIQRCINAASALGGGEVAVPPLQDGIFFRITSALLPRDNVVLRGTGYASFIKNTRATPLNTANADTGVFKIGGYESVYPAAGGVYTVYAETFYPCADGAVGSQTITLSTPANAAHFATGDIAFLRSAAQDPTNTQKPIPLAYEMNEVTDANAVTGVVTFKHPLYSDYVGLTVAKSSGTLTAPNGERIRVIKRFKAIGLRLETADVSSGTAGLSYGGAWECEFRDLYMTRVNGAMLLQVMARCIFDNIHANYTSRFGEIAYFSHDNAFSNGFGSYLPESGLAPSNGWGTNEGARDSTFTRWNVNHGSADTLPLNFADCRNITYTKSRIEVAASQVAAIVGIYLKGGDYKPRGVIFADNDVKFMPGAPSNRPRAHIILDSGGPQGGGCTISNNRLHGEVYVAPILLSRLDIRDAVGSQYPCRGNLIEGNIVVVDPSVTTLPYNAVVVDYNNREPSGGLETMIDTAWTANDNTIRNNRMVSALERVSEFAVDGAADFAGTGTVARQYTVPQCSVGTRTTFKIRLVGHILGAMTNDPKTVAIRYGGSTLASVSFLAAETGTFRLEVDVGAQVLNQFRTAITSSLTMPYQQTSTVKVWKNDVLTSSSVITTVNGDTAARTLDSFVTIGNTHADYVTIDEWTVEPSGSEWTEVPWTRLLGLFGGYPVVAY